MHAVFVFGALTHPPVLHHVIGPSVTMQPAILSGFRAVFDRDRADAALVADPDGRVAGQLIPDLSDDQIARLKFHAAVHGAAPQHCTVQTATGEAAALHFGRIAQAPSDAPDWDDAGWRDPWAKIATVAAEDIMARMGHQAPETLQPLLPYMRARGWARDLARNGAPAQLRRSADHDAVDLGIQNAGYDGFFRVRQFDIRHRRFDGDWSPSLRREALVGFDVALVLPYDPVADTVLLVEQLRFGPLLRGDPAPWVLEPVAGFIEAGEDPETAARREAEEETGLALGDLRPMPAAYASPGYSTEFFHFFLAICDLSEAGGLGGAEAEHEDIRAHVIGFDRAMALLDSGEVNAAPLAMMLLWLARARPGLRGLA